MRKTSIYCFDCICGRHIESEITELVCKCGRMIVLQWRAEVTKQKPKKVAA